jgi:hypothetical protein
MGWGSRNPEKNLSRIGSVSRGQKTPDPISATLVNSLEQEMLGKKSLTNDQLEYLVLYLLASLFVLLNGSGQRQPVEDPGNHRHKNHFFASRLLQQVQ